MPCQWGYNFYVLFDILLLDPYLELLEIQYHWAVDHHFFHDFECKNVKIDKEYIIIVTDLKQ